MNYPENDSDFRCITCLTPTVCQLCGVRLPAQNGDTPIQAVLDAAKKELGDEPVEKMLIFAPDAVGIQLWEKYPENLPRVQNLAPVRVPIRSVMPSVTPVNFASMYSGALPEVHGIQEYAKPVLTCETLFNVFPECNKKTAICASNGCSIDTIFRKRKITYISSRTDAESFNFTEMLLRNYDYDFILDYMGDYDSIMHKTAPFAPEAIRAYEICIETFEKLVQITDEVWKGYNRLVIWSPDHGSHLRDNGHGTHGSDLPEDLLVYHFYRVKKGTK